MIIPRGNLLDGRKSRLEFIWLRLRSAILSLDTLNSAIVNSVILDWGLSVVEAHNSSLRVAINSPINLITMPPRWSRIPDRNDADYRRLDDRMTFATHVAAFGCINSGLWFFHTLNHTDWAWLIWVTGISGTALLLHGVYVFAIANYSPNNNV